MINTLTKHFENKINFRAGPSCPLFWKYPKNTPVVLQLTDRTIRQPFCEKLNNICLLIVFIIMLSMFTMVLLKEGSKLQDIFLLLY